MPAYPETRPPFPWKKFGFGVAAVATCAVICGGLTYAYLRYKFGDLSIYSEKEFDRPPELLYIPSRKQQVINTVKIMLDKGIDHNTHPNKRKYFIIKGFRFGFGLLPMQANNLLDRGMIIERDWNGFVHRYQNPHPSYRNNPDFTQIPELIELVENHTHKKNAAAISQKIFEHPREIKRFNHNLTDIMGAYAAEVDRDVRDITQPVA